MVGCVGLERFLVVRDCPRECQLKKFLYRTHPIPNLLNKSNLFSFFCHNFEHAGGTSFYILTYSKNHALVSGYLSVSFYQSLQFWLTYCWPWQMVTPLKNNPYLFISDIFFRPKTAIPLFLTTLAWFLSANLNSPFLDF